jgi:hypothetical protein
VLVGDFVQLQPDNNLRMPPEKPKSDTLGRSKERYDSVKGQDKDNIVYVLYTNGHAYPSYLITYTCSDPRSGTLFNLDVQSFQSLTSSGQALIRIFQKELYHRKLNLRKVTSLVNLLQKPKLLYSTISLLLV